MNYNRKEIFNLIEDFMNTCQSNNIWFAADKSTILGMVRHGGFIPWNDMFEVMMTPESYRKLQRLFPKNIVDSSYNPKFKSLKPLWVKDSSDIDSEQPFIEIGIVVPATIKSINKFRSVSRHAFNVMTLKKDNIKHAINDLYEEKNEGFYQITSRRDDMLTNWIHNFSFQTKTIKLNHLDVPVPVEYEALLTHWYGDDYMQAKLPTSYVTHTSPTKKVTVKL